jgi:hypothetical protein
MKDRCAIGVRISLLPQHWLRPYEIGVVIDQQPRALKKWLVQFEESYPGGGIGGDKMWCDESDFAEVIRPRSEATRTAHIPETFPLADAPTFSGIGENGVGDRSNGNGNAVLS